MRAVILEWEGASHAQSFRQAGQGVRKEGDLKQTSFLLCLGGVPPHCKSLATDP